MKLSEEEKQENKAYWIKSAKGGGEAGEVEGGMEGAESGMEGEAPTETPEAAPETPPAEEGGGEAPPSEFEF